MIRHLIHRAADVILKQRKKFVLVVRQTPLHEGHLGYRILDKFDISVATAKRWDGEMRKE